MQRVEVVVAIPLGLTAAATFAVSAVLQQRAAQSAPEGESLSPRLLLDLARRPGWVFGIGCLVLAYLFQATALRFGDVSLVQPLVIAELAFALPLAMRAKSRRPGGREWLGVACVVGGIGAFIALASPRAGNPLPSSTTWALLAGPCAVVVGTLLLVARGPETPRRAALLAASAGVTNGLLALVTKSMVTVLGKSVAAVVTSWQLYVVVALGLLGLLLAQSAYQAGPLAISLPIIDAVEPVVAVLLGMFGFGERLSTSAINLAGELAGVAFALVGVVLLGRSPLVTSIYLQSTRKRRRTGRGRK